MTTILERYLSGFYNSLNTIEFVFLCILLGSITIQLIYYLFFYARAAFHNKDKIEIEKKPVSVIICARNENENLKKFLPLILEQKYPNFEVVVVNDCSTDESAVTLYNFAKQYPHLYYTNIPADRKFEHSKKLALTIGIKAAKNDWILLTDADCKPDSAYWLNKMQRNFTDDTDFVLGYSGYLKESKLVNYLIRFDTVSIAVQYIGFALAGIPYMGVGRNLAYRKKVFFDNKGFARHNHIVSGDDDLFVNQNAKGSRTKVELNWEGQTHSLPKKSVKEWVKQKRRHLSTSKYYKLKHKVLLFFEPFSRIIFYFSLLFLIINSKFIEIFIGIFAFRFIIQHIVYLKSYIKFNEKALIWGTFVLDILMPFINLYILLTRAFLKNKNTWR